MRRYPVVVSPPITAAVLIATYNRPELLRICLSRVAEQTVSATSIIVVDSSSDDRSRMVAKDFDATYVRNPFGRGHTATSRMLGVALSGDSDVIAFIDDDAFAAPEWLESLLRRYEDSAVAGVGGRATNGQPGEKDVGRDDIGRFHTDGTLSGYFAADPGRDVDVDHLLGANMSLRLSVVHELGGIQDYYPGTCLREESEIALRARLAGWRLIYTPDAVVEHVAGPYAKGRRFDARYSYYAQRNHLVLLGRVVGRADARFWRYLAVALREVRAEISSAGRSVRRRRLFGSGSIVRGVARGLVKASSGAAGALVGAFLVLSGRIPYARPPGPSSSLHSDAGA